MLPGLFKKENVRDLNKSTFYDWRPSDIRDSNYPEIETSPPVHETRPFLIGTKTKSFHRNDHDRIPTQARSRNERNSVRTELRSSPRYDRAGYLIVQEVQGGTGSCRIRWSTVRRKRDARKATLQHSTLDRNRFCLSLSSTKSLYLL